MMLYLSFFNFIKITYIKKFKNSKIYKLKKKSRDIHASTYIMCIFSNNKVWQNILLKSSNQFPSISDCNFINTDNTTHSQMLSQPVMRRNGGWCNAYRLAKSYFTKTQVS